MKEILLICLIITLVGYLIGSLLYVVNFFTGYNSKASLYVTIIGFIFNTFSLIARFFLTGHLPLGNIFEFGLFFLWAIIFFYIFVEFKYKISSLGIVVLPLSTIFTIYLTFVLDPTHVSPLMPALRSHWLHFHVLMAIIAYGALAISFSVALIYLVKDSLQKSNDNEKFVKCIPELHILENLAYKLIIFAMPFLTMVLITGAIWAEFSWGSYWSWDPKETWALITWIIYSLYLHARLMRGWEGKKIMLLAIAGFIAVIFTFLGVTYLLPGLHSYN